MYRNIKILIIIVFILIGIFSCNNKSKTVYEYYKTGELYSEIFYPDKRDKTSYLITLYYKNGNLKLINEFQDEKLNGKYKSFYEDGTINQDYSYKSGFRHGITREYSSKYPGKLILETLYLEGKPVVYKKYFINKKTGNYKFEYFLVKDSLLEGKTRMIYNKDDEIIKRQSFFYVVEGKDTLQEGIKECITINFINKREDFKMKVAIGELDTNLCFKYPDNVEIFSSQKDSIRYCFTPKYLGYNLLTGKINLLKDTINLEYILFKEFYVLPN